MPQGRERNVLRWDVHAALLETKLRAVEAALAALDAAPHADPRRAEHLHRQREDLRHALADLGPSPRAKMG